MIIICLCVQKMFEAFSSKSHDIKNLIIVYLALGQIKPWCCKSYHLCLTLSKLFWLEKNQRNVAATPKYRRIIKPYRKEDMFHPPSPEFWPIILVWLLEASNKLRFLAFHFFCLEALINITRGPHLTFSRQNTGMNK